MKATRLILLTLVLLVPVSPCSAGDAEKPVSSAKAFVRALSSTESTAGERAAAWDALRAADKPLPKAVGAAIDKAGESAWWRLTALIRSNAVRKGCKGLRTRSSSHQENVRKAVRDGGFSRGKLDRATAPIDKELQAARAAMEGAPGYGDIVARSDEIENNAVQADRRFGWTQELRDMLILLALVSQNTRNGSHRPILARNRQVGRWVDPCEEACAARLNVHRLLIGLQVMYIDPRLVIASKKHSEEMVEKGYFSHKSPTEGLKSPGDRAKREYTSWSGWCGECIARPGRASGLRAFRQWYYSQGHHGIMISGAACVGVGSTGGTFTLMVGNDTSWSAPRTVKMDTYVRGRYRAGDDPDMLFKVARWCQKDGLKTQAMDELARVLKLKPDHKEAARMLKGLQQRKPGMHTRPMP